MAALVDFLFDLREAKPGNPTRPTSPDYSLEVTIDTDAATLGIFQRSLEDVTVKRHLLLLWVETDLPSSDLLLNSQPCDWGTGDRSCAGNVARTTRVQLPYAKTALVDIHLGREGNYFYVHLLVADGDRTTEDCPPASVRFQLGENSCYQLAEGSYSPAVVPVDRFLSPSLESPQLLSTDFSTGYVLPWPVSLVLLMLACALAGWICAVAGQTKENPGASMATLMFLLGTVPFFARRVGGFTLFGVLVVTVVGIFVSLSGFLFKANVVVLAVLAMGTVLSLVFSNNGYGKAKAAQIELENNQPGKSRFIATRTEQEQNMLWIGDFAIVLAVTVLLVWAYSSIRAWIN
ncbi:hypothetical protein [Dechloromonas sp. ZS-1]|uniref:hypothetical protein n=1 Tax=Dechloromonas sp. ZS-1 TaxID=3138067 RepID=UPI0031FD1962